MITVRTVDWKGKHKAKCRENVAIIQVEEPRVPSQDSTSLDRKSQIQEIHQEKEQ